VRCRQAQGDALSPGFDIPSRGRIVVTAAQGSKRTARASLSAGQQSDVFVLAADESEHYLETGELPERAEHWLDDSQHDT